MKLHPDGSTASTFREVGKSIRLRPLIRRDENSRTTDEYVTSLYDKLKSALASARDAALLEAQRQKQLYDHRAGAVELHPGDKVLVKLDAFRGQRRKFKKTVGRCPLYGGEMHGGRDTSV